MKLAQMHGLLGNSQSFAFNLVCVEMQSVPLKHNSADAIRAGLQAGTMFEFKKVTVEAISSA